MENELETVRKRKSNLKEDEYYDMLEAILLKLSEIYLSTDSEGNLIETSIESDSSWKSIQ